MENPISERRCDSMMRVLSGNLYPRGGGDPNLSYDKFALMLRALYASSVFVR